MENQSEILKKNIIKKNDIEQDLTFLSSQYSQVLQNIKNICGAAVGNGSELYTHIEKLRQPESIECVDAIFEFYRSLLKAYDKNKSNAKELKRLIKINSELLNGLL